MNNEENENVPIATNIDGIGINDGIRYLNGDITNEKIMPLIDYIYRSNETIDSNLFREITIVINSSGGILVDGLALIDTMNLSKIPIKTIAIGEVGSTALLIFMNGEPKSRLIGRNTGILSHQYRWLIEGSYSELVAKYVEIENMNNRMINHYVKCTGLDKQVVIDKLLTPVDVWLTPQQTIDYGIADVIS